VLNNFTISQNQIRSDSVIVYSIVEQDLIISQNESLGCLHINNLQNCANVTIASCTYTSFTFEQSDI
jgi:hypothetical protein